MGCTQDTFNASFGSKKDTIAFTAIYNEMLKDDLCNGHLLTEDDFHADNMGGYELNVFGEPLFHIPERGQQFERVIKKFLQDNPDAWIYADYYGAFTNCGETTITTYTYKDGVLTIDYRNGDLPYETYCEECEYDSDDEDDGEPIIRLEDWEPDTVCKCPNCGAEIEFNACHIVEKIKIK